MPADGVKISLLRSRRSMSSENSNQKYVAVRKTTRVTTAASVIVQGFMKKRMNRRNRLRGGALNDATRRGRDDLGDVRANVFGFDFKGSRIFQQGFSELVEVLVFGGCPVKF